MHKRIKRTISVICLTSVLLASMAVPTSAQQPDHSREIAEMEQWLNGLTVTPREGSPGNISPAVPATSPTILTASELKAHTDTMFRLVNAEREKSGVAPLVRNEILDEAAMIRAAEIRVVDFAGGAPHTRPDGTSWRTLLDEMGIDGNRCGENINRNTVSPASAMDSWMRSDGHRDNILRERYGSIGIGVYQRADGSLDWIQIFMRK